ncbi:MAG: hypothetical protein J5J00_14975 [Deltaproteobacteria bacterium]|nr:hypothetical protein [Deltaproteobacteria bacterium]
MRWSFLFVLFSLSTVSAFSQEADAPDGGAKEVQAAAPQEPAADPPAEAPAPKEPENEGGEKPANAAAPAAEPDKGVAATDGAAKAQEPATEEAPVTAEPDAAAPMPAPDQSLILEKVVEYMMADREVQRLKPWADYYNKARKQNEALSDKWRRVASRLEQVQAARDTAAKYLEANCPHVKRFIDSEAARVSADWGNISGQK